MSSDEKLTPERVIRLLRAKNGELENAVLQNAKPNVPHARLTSLPDIWQLTADLALLFAIVADHIELCTPIPLPLATEQRQWQEEARGPAPGWKPEPRQ